MHEAVAGVAEGQQVGFVIRATETSWQQVMLFEGIPAPASTAERKNQSILGRSTKMISPRDHVRI